MKVKALFLGVFMGVFMALLHSCKPEELPVPSREEPAGSVEASVNMGADYEYQIFYDLVTDKVVSKNLKTKWDLAFDTDADGFHVYLNSSKFMAAASTGQSNWNQVADTSGLAQAIRWDAASGHPDSTAIGDWRTGKPVYLIDRGTVSSGHLGFCKLQITEVTATQYSLRFQRLPAGDTHELTVMKQPSHSRSYLSFDEGGKVVDVAPPKHDWDVCFTQFTVQIPIPYLVTGVLINPARISVACDSLTGYEAVSLDVAQAATYSTALDAIGYEWKLYDFDASAYIVDPTKVYLIKTNDAVYYKMHFIDFYDEAGIKGNPKWQITRLN